MKTLIGLFVGLVLSVLNQGMANGYIIMVNDIPQGNIYTNFGTGFHYAETFGYYDPSFGYSKGGEGNEFGGSAGGVTIVREQNDPVGTSVIATLYIDVIFTSTLKVENFSSEGAPVVDPIGAHAYAQGEGFSYIWDMDDVTSPIHVLLPLNEEIGISVQIDGIYSYVDWNPLVIDPNKPGEWDYFNSTLARVAAVEVPSSSAPVPIPPALLLLGSGIIGLMALKRKIFMHE